VECWVKGHQKFFFAADWASPKRVTESHMTNAIMSLDEQRQSKTYHAVIHNT